MIICCGEALIDMLPSDDGHSPVLGGSIFNTARAAARVGLETAYVSPLSSDAFGDDLLEALEDAGVDTRYVKRVDRPTALAWVSFENGQPAYRFEDEGSASRMASSQDLPSSVPDCTLAHFGSISLVTEPCAVAYEQFLLRMAKTALIGIDPNIRPAFITDPEEHLQRLERLFAHADIIKLSDEDLEWFGMTPDSEALDKAVNRWLAARASLVVVTRGARGATGYCVAGRIDVPAPKVEVRDTVGAGDAFSAGLYSGLHSGGLLRPGALANLSIVSMENALAAAVATSARVVQQVGAELPATS